MRKLTLISLFLFGICLCSKGQDVITIPNPSFEDTPRAGRAFGMGISGFKDCSSPGQTNVDVQPGFFEVDLQPIDGQSYVGMVVRKSESWEAISAKLSFTLEAGQPYSFSIDLARAKNYISLSAASGKEENFITPCKLRIWGGDLPCAKKQLLAQSELIQNNTWKRYNFTFIPDDYFNYIVFEVFYETPFIEAYDGNILLDNCSDFYALKDTTNLDSLLNASRNPKNLEKIDFNEPNLWKNSYSLFKEMNYKVNLSFNKLEQETQQQIKEIVEYLEYIDMHSVNDYLENHSAKNLNALHIALAALEVNEASQFFSEISDCKLLSSSESKGCLEKQMSKENSELVSSKNIKVKLEAILDAINQE